MQTVHDGATMNEKLSVYALEPLMGRLLAEHEGKEEIAQWIDTRMG